MDAKAKKYHDPILVFLKELMPRKFVESFFQRGYGVLRYQCRLCFLDVNGLREKILKEAHVSRCYIHS